jgi:hypothetical protein
MYKVSQLSNTNTDLFEIHKSPSPPCVLQQSCLSIWCIAFPPTRNFKFRDEPISRPHSKQQVEEMVGDAKVRAHSKRDRGYTI